MSDYLNILDIKLFRLINGKLSNPVFDWLMPFLTDLNKQTVIIAFCGALLLWMIVRGSMNARIAALLLVLTIICSDQLSSQVIKYWFERLRPCRTLHSVNLLVGCGSGFSFPSSHAVNNFAGALILTFFFPKYKWWFWIFASLIAFSRVYVGVHYPSDVIGGGIIGLVFAGSILAIFVLLEKIWRLIYFRNPKHKKS